MEIISSHVFAQINIELIVCSSDLWLENDLGILPLQTKSAIVLLYVGNEDEIGETV